MGEFPPDITPTSSDSSKRPGRPRSGEPKRMDIRPIRREDIDAAVARAKQEDIPLSAASAVGQEPYALDLAKENSESRHSKDDPTFNPAVAPGFNSESEDEGVPFFINPANKQQESDAVDKISGYQKIGEVVNERIQQLKNEGYSESDAHARAHDEFWRVVDPEDSEKSPIEDGYRRIGEAVNKRIDELKNEGMSESDAHARAHDEFWRVVDPTPPPTPPPGPPTPPPGPPTPPPGPPTPPPGPPKTPSEEEGPIKMYALDTSETDTVEASRKAAIRLESEIREVREKLFSPNNPRPGRFAKLVNIITMPIKAIARPKEFFTYLAKSSVGKDYYLQKYKAESLSGMDGFDYHSEIAKDVAARFDSAEYILQNGERKLAEDTPEVREVKDRLNEVFRSGITGTMDRDTVLTESKRIIAAAPWLQANSEESIHLVQNLEEAYDRITTAVDHEAGLGAIDAAYELVGGEVTLGVNAEVRKTATDRIMEKLTNSPLKALIVNEATVGMAVGAVVGAIGFLAKSKGVKAGTAALIGGPIAMVATAGASALFAYGREKMRMRQDRALHMAERAMGGNGPEGNEKDTPRRVEMEGVIYEMASSQDILSSYEGLIPEDISTMTDEDARSLQSWLIALRTNQTVGDENNIDLIQYSSEDSVESEKTQLFEARARANVALRQYTAQHPDFMAQIPGESYDAKLDFLVNAQTEQLMQGEIADKDRAFRRLSRNRATKRAAATAAFSLVGSYIAHQITDHFVDQGTVMPRDPGVLDNQQTVLSQYGHSIDMPKDWSIRGNTLLDAQGHTVITDYQYNPDGSLSQHTIQSLQSKGFRFSETTNNIQIVTTREVPVDVYASTKPEQFTQVNARDWADNMTRAFDRNELRADFNVLQDGTIKVSINRMTNDGSFDEAVRIAAANERGLGNLKLLVTPDKNNQSLAQMLEFDQDGNAYINPSDPTYSWWDLKPGNPEGIQAYPPAFAEVALPKPGEPGNFYILATEEGFKPPGLTTITETTDIPVFHGTLVVPKAPDPIIDPYVPFIPVAGVFPRKPLEKIMPGGYVEPYITSPYAGYNSGEFAPGDDERIKKRFSEKLRNNPDAVLDPKEEIRGYLDRMDVKRRESLNETAKELEPMSEAVKLVVSIPVNGSQEGKNIYQTLRWYTGQVDGDGKPLDPSTYEIVLFVNKTTDRQWDESLSEIERFRKDFPNMPIRVVQKEYNPEEAKIGRIRKDAADLTLVRQLNRQTGQDVTIVSNDADCKGVGESYLATIMEQIDAQSADGLSGRLEWDPTTNAESPLYHAGVKFMQMLDVIDRHPLPGTGREPRYRYPGANFAFSSSIYAAIGGYDEGSTLAEDVVLGRTIKLARNGSSVFKGIGFYGGDNVVYTDSRRGIVAFNNGYPPSMQWSKLRFGVSDGAREGVEIEDAIDYDLLLQEDVEGIDAIRQQRIRKRFEAEMARFIEQTITEYHIIGDETSYHDGMKLPRDVELALRAIKALRLDADLDVNGGNVKVTIDDASRFYEYLRNYRQNGMRNYAARTGLERIFPGGLGEVFPELEAA